MPNHITTKLKFTGSKKQIEDFKKECFTSNYDDIYKENFTYLDFSKIIPIPDNIFQGNLGEEERIKYGKNNWYDWNIENWGTKWNSYSNVITDKYIRFETAWSFPFPVILELSKKYPKIKFTAVYCDEDYLGDNFGKIEYINGEEREIEIKGGKQLHDRLYR